MMELWIHQPRLARYASCLAIIWLSLWTSNRALSSDPVFEQPIPPSPMTLEDQLHELEQRYATVIEENRRLTDGSQKSAGPHWGGDKSIGNSDGVCIATSDSDSFPFEVNFHNQAQLRYAKFSRGVENWTNSVGTFPVTDRSGFELTRGRAIFSGYAFDPKLTYYLNIDYTTVTDNQLNFWNYWLSYQFSRRLSLFIGQAAVPGSREWLTPAIYTLGPDYSLATTFFRPSLSQGIWATGELKDGLYYRAMLSNGFNTLGLSQREQDARLALSGSVWAEPLGKFGTGFSDFDWHHEPAIRLGSSFVVAPTEGQQGNPNQPENSDIRLTNGTLITEIGALAPGVTLQEYTVSLGAIDFGWKYHGISFNGEFYMRGLTQLRADGPIPRSSIFDYGGYAQVGCFIVPQKFELYGRTSLITGAFGSGSEYAGGFNWFLLPERQNLRFTLDLAWVNQSPADQVRTDYRAGDTGMLIRSQLQFFF